MRSIFLALLLVLSQQAVAESGQQPSEHAHHGHHSGPVLTEAGNDAFGTMQEVVNRLNADPDTDWSKVDLEALRQHLVDMDNFTKQVSVVDRRNIENGVELVVVPDNDRAGAALARAMSAHPAMVRQEAGWDMRAVNSGKGYRLTITSPDPADAERIRGLGYIGIMALGNHHQAHHWAMATGKNPHRH